MNQMSRLGHLYLIWRMVWPTWMTQGFYNLPWQLLPISYSIYMTSDLNHYSKYSPLLSCNIENMNNMCIKHLVLEKHAWQLGFTWSRSSHILHREPRDHLQALPQHLWCKNVLRCIEEDIGIYLDHDRSYIESHNIAIARILVHLNRRDSRKSPLAIQGAHHMAYPKLGGCTIQEQALL